MNKITTLDGGLGQEIYRRSRLKEAPLWSVEAMMKEPEIVTKVHRDFIEAGAQILTLNTYAATPTRLKAVGRSSDFIKIHQLAKVAMANAIDSGSQSVKIAGCLPPLHGSYRNTPNRSPNSLRDEYEGIAQLHPEVDLWLIETMTNPLETEAAVAVASETGKPVLLSYRLEADGNLKSGHTLLDMRARFDHSHLLGVSINCCEPEVITQHIDKLKIFNVPFGAYGNGFKSVKALADGGSVSQLEAREDLSPSTYANYVDRWIDVGATIVGGCCEITPAHIAEIVRRQHKLC